MIENIFGREKKVTLSKENPSNNRLVKKLVSLHDTRTHKPNTDIEYDISSIQKLSKQINADLTDNESLFEILPDIKLAMQVLVSGILSPKDMMAIELNYTLNETIRDKELTSNTIDHIHRFFSSEYKLKKILPKMLEDILFKTGSYAMLILPETTIDKTINSDCLISNEEYSIACDSIQKPIGLLNHGKRALDINSYTTITDNFDILKMPWITDKRRSENIKSLLLHKSISLESESVSPIKYYKRKYEHVPLQCLSSDSESDILGNPIVIKLPTESIVPVHIPGDPTDHIGYFVLVDENGYPVSGKKERTEYSKVKDRAINNSESKTRELIRQTRQAIFGSDELDMSYNDSNIKTYSSVVERLLAERMAGGLYNDDVEISDISIISKIMLTRALAKKRTFILYVPLELMVYMAFDYSKEGTGRSLLDNSKILSSLRSILLFSNTMASVRNSVPRTGVKITLDETDPDPQATVEYLLNQFMMNHNQTFPIGLTNPSDITDAIQRSSIDVAVSGNSAYPETTMDITDKTRNIATPDSDLENQMRRRHYMSFGLPPEIIDADMNIDFATMIISSNLLTAKQISIYQELFTEFISDFVRKFIRFSKPLQDNITDSLSNIRNKAKPSLEDVIMAIEVTLPSPNTSKLENQINAFKTYSDSLTSAMDCYINSSMLGRVIDSDIEDVIEPAIAIIKSYYERQWLRKNNVMPELDYLTRIGSNDDPLELDKIQDEHVKSLIKTLGKLLLSIKEQSHKVMKKVESDEEENAPPEEETIPEEIEEIKETSPEEEEGAEETVPNEEEEAEEAVPEEGGEEVEEEEETEEGAGETGGPESTPEGEEETP